MKTKNLHSAADQGSVLMVSLILCMIMGLTLASYLTLTRTQLSSVRRSQSWNTCLAASEAGVEDALCHINSPSGLAGIFASNGWSLQADGSYSVTRYVPDGYYTVSLTLVALATGPVITSQGFSQIYLAQASQPMFAAAGAQTATPAYSSRKVQITTKLDSLLSVTMAAKRTINFSGNNVATDSFDSADPNYSTNGLYVSTKTKANGDVVTDSTITNDFNVGNADIKGLIRTGPKGVPYLGPNASVGDAAWVNAGTVGIQSGHFFDDMNVIWPDVTLPGNTWYVPVAANTNIAGKSYKYYLTDGNWRIDDISSSVYVDGNAVVYVPPTGKINVSGNDVIYIAPNPLGIQQKSLKIYAAPATTSLGGNGVINATGNALNFFYYGLPSNKAFGLSANAAFVGCIYCPNAAFTLGGGGGTPYDFVGASVSDTVKMNGHFKFHYDENLRRIGPGRGYVATSWKEL